MTTISNLLANEESVKIDINNISEIKRNYDLENWKKEVIYINNQIVEAKKDGKLDLAERITVLLKDILNSDYNKAFKVMLNWSKVNYDDVDFVLKRLFVKFPENSQTPETVAFKAKHKTLNKDQKVIHGMYDSMENESEMNPSFIFRHLYFTEGQLDAYIDQVKKEDIMYYDRLGPVMNYQKLSKDFITKHYNFLFKWYMYDRVFCDYNTKLSNKLNGVHTSKYIEKNSKSAFDEWIDLKCNGYFKDKEVNEKSQKATHYWK